MLVTYTDAGTPVIDLTPEEQAAYLEREVQSAVGMSVEEFIRAYTAGELEEGDVAVDEMVSLLRIGQIGIKLPRSVAEDVAGGPETLGFSSPGAVG